MTDPFTCSTESSLRSRCGAWPRDASISSPTSNRFTPWTNAMQPRFCKRAYSAASDLAGRSNTDPPAELIGTNRRSLAAGAESVDSILTHLWGRAVILAAAGSRCGTFPIDQAAAMIEGLTDSGSRTRRHRVAPRPASMERSSLSPRWLGQRVARASRCGIALSRDVGASTRYARWAPASSSLASGTIAAGASATACASPARAPNTISVSHVTSTVV